MASNVPLGLAYSEIPISLEGRQASPNGALITAGNYVVEPEYFETLAIPLLWGRNFTNRDNQSSPKVIIINQTMARRFWPNEEPLGRRIQLIPQPRADAEYFEVVGVARDHKYASYGEDPRPCFYRPFAQNYQSQMNLLVHSVEEPGALLAALRQTALALDQDAPLLAVKTLEENSYTSLLPWRIAATLAGAAGLVALLLAGVGVYGVVSSAVNERLPEIGIRLALGARGADILRLLLGQWLRFALAGLGIGALVGLGAARLLGGFLFGVGALDPMTFVLVPALLLAVALLSGYLPARKAMKTDPMAVLRRE